MVTWDAASIHEFLNGIKSEHAARGENVGSLFAYNSKETIESILEKAFQEAFGAELYPSLPEKLCCIMYEIIKSHVFVDGNKRAATGTVSAILTQEGFAGVDKIGEYLSDVALIIAESDYQEDRETREVASEFLSELIDSL